MSYSKEQVISSYQRVGNMSAVCLETGCPPYIAYKWLKMSKMLKPKEATRYGTNGQKQGALAELEFQRLVPFAMSANRSLENNCPAFDFDINGITVDVKFCSICASTNTYQFRAAHSKPIKPDFYCVFIAAPEIKELVRGRYRLLVMPHDLLSAKTINIQKNSGRYWDFEIAPDQLADFFREYLGANESLAQHAA